MDNYTINKDNKIPDYRISRIVGKKYDPALEFKSFSIYIIEQVPIDNTSTSVKGTIDDCFGMKEYNGEMTADFHGEISDKEFNITIKYREKAIQNGAPKEEILYKGHKKKEAYIGNFKVITNGVDIPFSNNNRFSAKKYDTKMNVSDVPFPHTKKNFDATWN